MAQAIKYITEHADELNVYSDDYAVAGFSAGGHLAASIGTENLGYKKYNIKKPGALFLAYPLIHFRGQGMEQKLKVGWKEPLGYGIKKAFDCNMLNENDTEKDGNQL